ncbi:hypothetical protein [Roseimaritima sediminicola]|uniref:hypothetical protein n=1 Tax=Roseimaritima sediminicola TaxID=2662066 RepID=UPI0012983926|nr:hypothetical protein [Roseimaritima sediminicola]
MQRLKLHILTILLLLATPCRGQDVSAEQLSRVHLQRVPLYFGWEFEYESSLVTDDGETIELENVLVLDAPVARSSAVVRRLWIAKRENPGEPHLDDTQLMHRFAGWNGSEYRQYERNYLSSNTDGIKLGRGAIFASDRASYTDNYFDAMLTSGPHGVPQYVDVSGKVFDKHPLQFRVIGRGERLDVGTLKVEARQGAELLAEAELSDTAEKLLMWQVTYHNNQPVMQWEVTALGRFDDTLYPASGKMDREQVGDIRPLEYRFEVKNVSWNNRSVDEWFPQWPQGTAVIDQTDGAKQAVIPYPEDVSKRIVASKGMGAVSSFRSGRGLVFLLVNLCIVGAIGYFFIRRRRGAH